MAITAEIVAERRPPGELKAPPAHRLIRDAFVGWAGSSAYPCLGARSVVHREAFALRVYGGLGSPGAAATLCRDLAGFVQTVEPDRLSSFVAVFTSPVSPTETHFSTLLWRQLQRLHDCDRRRFAWDPRVSADPANPDFSFSVAGRAFFVVGMHPRSSRWARRFAWPTLVFNPHEQFVAMREAGTYDRVRTLIRARDADLQGDVNPVLVDHGLSSEAPQYAGHSVPIAWRCPLRVKAP